MNFWRPNKQARKKERDEKRLINSTEQGSCRLISVITYGYFQKMPVF